MIEYLKAVAFILGVIIFIYFFLKTLAMDIEISKNSKIDWGDKK